MTETTGGMPEGVPARAGPYRLQSRLGAGGMGEVLLALDPYGRTVAVKLLHPGGDRDAAARLDREADTMRRVRSPHVAEVVGTGSVDTRDGVRPYVATRYVQGRPLDAAVRADGPLRGDDLVRVARGLAAALAAIHAAGVVHRDLKPANVMLVDGEPVVIDFGIACAAASSRVTETGVVIGTAGYLAPEVLRDERAGPAADVFAWAATVTHAATGRPAFGAGPLEQVFYRVLHEEPDLSGVPAGLLPLVTEGFAKDPAARPAAADLTARLGGPLPAGATMPDGPAPQDTAPLPASAEPAGRDVPGPAVPGPDRPYRSHAARRREERMRRIRARKDAPSSVSRRGLWWLLIGALVFAAGMAAADDHVSARTRIVAHAAYAGLLAVAFLVAWVRRGRGGAGGAPWGTALLFALAAAGGSGLAVLLGALVSSTVMIFVLALVVVLGLATLLISG